jgi:hypothetical protein
LTRMREWHRMRPLPRFRSLLPALTLALILAIPIARPVQAAGSPSRSAYRGLGTWVDIYDRTLWRDPEAVVAKMHGHGVRTLFLETGNWRIESRIFKPDIVARFLEAAHDRGMKAVAWYVPDFRNLERDLRRALAAVRFETAGGQRFDSFGLDIESAEVTDPNVRTTRMLRLSARLRRSVGSAYPLAAIVPSPHAMRLIPAYWPGFPFRELASLYDVFIPMGYFTFRTNGPSEAAAYTAATLRLLSDRTGGAPIHAIGGLAEDTSGSEVRAFVQAALGEGVIGASLYDFDTTGPKAWSALTAVQRLSPKPPKPQPQPPATRSPLRDAPPLPLSLNRSHFLAR